MKFIDEAEIHVKAGDGGVGCVSFRREKFVPKGGPDGGDGGKGGDVVFRANRQLGTLLDFQYKSKYSADRGDHGLGARKTGKSGNDVVIEVPVGTLIKDAGTGELIADLVGDRDEVIIAKGGRGGRGNEWFKTSTNQAPRQFEQGEPGGERELTLELKLLADVGLVGFPNAGKSTLISVVSAARPRIADYPFTTLVPNLGIVGVREGESFVMADIPGLIEGAHDGKGLGYQFLKHIERTRVLAFLIEGISPDPVKDYLVLLEELRQFHEDLLQKPRIVALTKADLLSKEDAGRLEQLKFPRSADRPRTKVKSVVISSVDRTGIPSLLNELSSMVRKPEARAATGSRTP